MKNSVFILWIEGVNPESLAEIPSLSEMATRGVDLRLEPLPFVEEGNCYYQTLTGMGPGKFGRFDRVHPDNYKARAEIGVPDGAQGRLLPDLLRSKKMSAALLETAEEGELDTLLGQTFDCALARFLNLKNADPATIDAIVKHCLELVNPAAHVLVLTDVYHQEPHTLVNINDFFADVGLLEVGSSREQANILWPETLVYGLGTGQVWVNLRGRESEGIVSSGREYQEVCEAVTNELRTRWLDPQTKEPVIEQVIKKEDAYTGDYLFRASDLIVTYRPGYAASPKAMTLDFDRSSVRRVGTATTSKPHARLIASGPCLVAGTSTTASLIDVVPSVLYLLGQPIPGHIDGKVISSLFTETYRQQTPLHYMDEDADLLSDEDEGLIVDRLRALGYLG